MKFHRVLPLALFLLFSLGLVSCSSQDDPEPVDLPEPRAVADADYTVTESGLKYFDFPRRYRCNGCG